MKKIGVIGIGNPLRCDDGIGIVLLKKLAKEKKTFSRKIEFIDGGTGGMNLLHLLPQFDIVIIIDAMQLNSHPGSYYFFKVDEIKTNKNTISFSTHTDDLSQIIEMSKQLGELPKQLFIFGVQPKEVSYKTNISDELQNKIKSLLNSLQNEIKIVIGKNK